MAVRVLLLQLLWGFTALTEPVSDVFVEAEHDAVLQCDNVQHGQHHCNATTWIRSHPKSLSSKPAEEFITLGKMLPDFRYKDRFSLTESCSLVIKGAQIADNRQFLCKQYRSGQEISQTSTMLSVVSLEEHDSGPNCYVSSPRPCAEIQVRWLYNDTEITEDNLTTQKFSCGATLWDDKSIYSTLQRELFACEIIFGDKKHTYKLKSEATEKSDKTTAEPGTKQDQTQTKPGQSQDQTRDDSSNGTGSVSSVSPGWWWMILVAVVAALTFTVVILLKRRRKKENRQEDNDRRPESLATETDPEDGISYASISYTKKNKSTPEPRPREEETVTYSAVKTPASHDVNALYSCVTKH